MKIHGSFRVPLGKRLIRFLFIAYLMDLLHRLLPYCCCFALQRVVERSLWDGRLSDSCCCADWCDYSRQSHSSCSCHPEETSKYLAKVSSASSSLHVILPLLACNFLLIILSPRFHRVHYPSHLAYSYFGQVPVQTDRFCAFWEGSSSEVMNEK